MIPIEDDESLYRRVLASSEQYNPETGLLSPQAFHPNKNDVTGLSLVRARFLAASDAARGRAGKETILAVLRAGDLRAEGIRIEPDDDEDRTWHAELPDLRYDNRRSNSARILKNLLASQLTREVLGPFRHVESQEANNR